MTFVLIGVSVLVALFGFVVAFGAPYVPSLRKEVRDAFRELYPVKKGDVLVDLGSGDGSVLLEASKRGAFGYGIELNPLLAVISRFRLGKRAVVKIGNMWLMKLPPETTLVYAFTVSRDTKRLESYLQHESDRLNKTLLFMTFGAKLPNQKAINMRNAHTLYEFQPLQHD